MSRGPRPMPGHPSITVERNVPSVMRDGVTLFSDIYRPVEPGAYPVIVIRLPYDKTQAENIAYAHPSYYAEHGYIVVSQDTRGRYASEGEWYPFRNEGNDGYDTIEWAAKLPGSTGQVGMYGFSYAGATQLLPAIQQPPSLAAICPAMTGSQYYEGWSYNGGALALGFVASWAASLGIANAKQRRDDGAMATYAAAFAGAMQWHWYLPLDQHPPLRTGDTDYFFDWLDHPTYDEYWKQWSIDEDYSRINVPGLHIAGWYDIFLSGTVKNFVGLRTGAGSDAARRAQKLIIGPWYHIPWRLLVDDPVDAASPNLVDDWQLAWFDTYLKGRTTDLLDSPVTIYVLGENRWRDFADWPPPQASAVEFFAHSGGRANSRFGDGTLSSHAGQNEPSDTFTYDPATPNQSQGGHSCCFAFAAPMGPADQSASEDFNGVLVYTSEPLSSDLLLVGDAEVVLYAATTAADTDWTARFCVVDAQGVSTNIQEGIIRARFRESLSHPTSIQPDIVYEYRIALGPVGVRLRAGECIRLTISSSDFPQWDRNLNTGGPLGKEPASAGICATQVVLHDAAHPTRLILPVVAE